ncbi:hypothetical protein [Flavobacterium sp. LHD-85]|uniref:hypothetical protein n=1 Tax=Flavobacterium sp. LHD-85 TaxID=3071410 RepID=UPI0027DF7ED7|nr:hypothetical protein [Flavobacterium sp. LHD-85]MDQ6530680.1 hypothetical protein [Flavobacterium sp. LHD-85]
MGNYLKPNWITFKGSINNFYNDYRPAIGPDGNAIVFERTSYNPEMRTLTTKLFIVDDLNMPSPHLFLSDCDSLQQTRPAWTGDNIALNLAYENKISVWTVDANGNNLKQIENTNDCIYPQWDINLPFEGLVVMNLKQPTQPMSTLFSLNGTIIIDNMNGIDTNGNKMFGGMPAVSPNNVTSIAFAGQPPFVDDPHYNQNKNYIFINIETEEGFVSVPMESSANLISFDKSFQGRAPAVSPDGNYIAFESNRDGCYALYLYNFNKPENGSICLTDPTGNLNSQHPKFFPDGRRLIFSAVPSGYTHSCIAWIDISEYL